MDVKLVRFDSERFIVASMSEGRIALVSYDRQVLVSDIRLPEGFGRAYAVTTDCRLLATGYWYTKGIDLWNVRTGVHVDRFGPNQVSRLLFDMTGRWLVVWGSRKFVRNIHTGEETTLPKLEDLDGGCVDTRSNIMWLPIDVKGYILCIQFDPLRIEEVALPIAGTVWSVCYSPSYDRALLSAFTSFGHPIGSAGTVSCFSEIGGDLLWKQDFTDKDVACLGSFTADGRLFALGAVNAQRVIVLDVSSGEIVRYIEPYLSPTYPLEGSLILGSGGRVLDAATSEIYDGVSKPAWWRAAGLKFGEQ